MGVGGALLALVIDRRREFGLLGFLGASKPQMRRIILFEAGLLGLLANIAGVILGFLLSLLLIFVINKQSFGWTIQFHWPVTVLLRDCPSCTWRRCSRGFTRREWPRVWCRSR